MVDQCKCPETPIFHFCLDRLDVLCRGQLDVHHGIAFGLLGRLEKVPDTRQRQFLHIIRLGRRNKNVASYGHWAGKSHLLGNADNGELITLPGKRQPFSPEEGYDVRDIGKA